MEKLTIDTIHYCQMNDLSGSRHSLRFWAGVSSCSTRTGTIATKFKKENEQMKITDEQNQFATLKH
eukprot:1498633-Amphidinium_carterae.1